MKKKNDLKIYLMVVGVNCTLNSLNPILLGSQKLKSIKRFTPTLEILDTHAQVELLRIQIAERDGDDSVEKKVAPLFIEVDDASYAEIIAELKTFGYKPREEFIELTLCPLEPCCILISSELMARLHNE